jgi:predicted DsbA family dithiol-disulfide isomerase
LPLVTWLRQITSPCDLLPAMISIRVEVFSDTLCPWCYIGKKHLDQAIYLFRQQHPNVVFEVEWKPFYLYPNLERIRKTKCIVEG